MDCLIKTTTWEEGHLDVNELGLIEIEGEEFDNYDQFFKWLEVQLKKRDLGVGPKFKTFDIVSLGDEDENDKYKVEENTIGKVKNLKQFHCMVPVRDTELMFRISTCTCSKCENFEYTECQRDEIHGNWVHHCI